ncbi:MAG: hypothetical protein AAB359_01095, partial [Elusimicrobiota bacterium]
MRLLTAILVLAATLPSYVQSAENYSVDTTVRLLDLDYSGNRGLVQEYDGKQYDGGEVDINFSNVRKRAYLDLVLNGINSGNEDGYFNLNLGSYLAVKGKFSILTHRQAHLRNGIINNGVTEWRPYITTLNADMPGMLFKRVESEARAIFSLPGNPDREITAGFWQENETGDTPDSYYSGGLKLTRGMVDRQTRDLSLGINAGISEGAFSADYTQRLFEDNSTQSATFIDMPTASRQKMAFQDLRFHNGAGAKVPVTAALSARTRTSAYNNYTGSAYSATLAAAYKPNKKTYLTAKFYGRTTGVYENRSVVDAKGKVWGVNRGPSTQIDRYNLSGDLKARHVYSDKLSFKAGYNYENNYRAHVATSSYRESLTRSTYRDGSDFPAYTHKN